MPPKILDAALRYADQGASLVLLRAQSKVPVEEAWASAPRLTVEALKSRWRGHNIGVRLGEPSKIGKRYLHALDMDISDPRSADEAWAAAKAMFAGAGRWAAVISGSRGESRHLYFLTDKPFRKRNLARSSRKITTASGKTKRAWEIDLYGTGVQVVLPPSVHPDTGLTYEWEGEEPDLSDLTVVPSAEIERVLAQKPAAATTQRAGRERDPLSIAELETALFEVPFYDNRDGGLDYDDWRDVVFAVHEHYAGTDDEEEAFAVLEEWSALSDKHRSSELERVYDAIHDEDKRESRVTIASLVKRLRDYEADPRTRRERWERGGIAFRDERGRAREMEEQDRERREADERLHREIEDARARGLEHPGEWRVRIERDGNRDPVFSVESLCLMIARHEIIQAIFRTDQVTRELVLVYNEKHAKECERFGLSPRVPHGSYDERHHYLALREIILTEAPTWAAKRGFTKALINDAVLSATDSGAYSPFDRTAELFAERWDGKRRIHRFLTDYLGAEDTRATEAISEFILCAAAARYKFPGVRVDNMLVLQGEEGGGKNRVWQYLCHHNESAARPCLLETAADITNPREYIAQTHGKIIVHFSELTAMRRKDAQTVKDFVTRPSDEARLVYARSTVAVPRTWVLVGSTNEERFLIDTTGNRRFLVVRCIKPESDEHGVPKFNKRFADLIRERGQIWAEAMHRVMEAAKMKGGGPLDSWDIDPSVTDELREAQAEAMEDTTSSELAFEIANILDTPKPYEEVASVSVRRMTEEERAQKAICNQCTYDEIADWLGMSAEEFRRNGTRVIGEAFRYAPLKEWVREAKAAKHKGVNCRVWRRKGTDGSPTPVTPEAKNFDEHRVIAFSDTRRRRII